MSAPHETPAFRNSVEYTVAITFRVEGGARQQTARRRAETIAERLANAASRAAHVVEVTATAGPSRDGTVDFSERVRFSAANTGRGTSVEPDRLDRYLDPEFELALASLAEAKAQDTALREADRERRRSLGCLNAFRVGSEDVARCACVYCAPDDHEHQLWLAQAGQVNVLRPPHCICGRPVPLPGNRCTRRHDDELVVLEGDPDSLRRLARGSRHDTPERDQQPRRPDGPDIAPPGR